MVNRLPSSPTPDHFVAALRARGWEGDDEAVLEAARQATGPDGRLSREDAKSLPADLRDAYRWLRGEQPRRGVISDIDKTILPKHRNDQPKPAPYPGARELLEVMDERAGDPKGDLFYVTARDEKRLRGIDAWMRSHGMPTGPVEGGVGGEPTLARREKLADIERIFKDNPKTRFILIGDNNHVDHEVFAELMLRHPQRIEAALIHRIKENRPVAPDLFVFDEHVEAARHLRDLGLISDEQAARVESASTPH